MFTDSVLMHDYKVLQLALQTTHDHTAHMTAVHSMLYTLPVCVLRPLCTAVSSTYGE